MKRIWSILILLFMYIGCMQAQRDYRRGYIITNQQDTIYGWIDYRGDTRNAKICSFRETETGSATDYTPSDIAAYRFIDSKYYVSKNIGSDDAHHQFFLEYLVNGMVKLYYYRDDDNNDQYFIEKDGHLLELKTEQKEEVVEGAIRKTTKKSYIGTLKATLNVWEMNKQIDHARLDHSSLIDIAKDYHHYVCTDGSECIVYEKKKPLIAVRIAPVMGADLSMFKLMDRDVEKYNLNPSTNLTIGVNLNFSMPRINEKLFLQIQAMYTKYYFFDAYKIGNYATDVHVHSNVLQMGLGIKYEYPKGKWRPTIVAGYGAIWMPDVSIKEITDTDHNYNVRSSIMKADFPTKFLQGFEMSPGVHYYLNPKRIVFIQAQYQQCYKRKRNTSYPANIVRSFGLSTGIYF